ncbi:MAG TPA: hydantoinase B/oxoprolinase family protein [Gaiellaceae bacterium]|nr:hydantoinase B/oxoprolinase family protein [Gaiellaceae bacterium]
MSEQAVAGPEVAADLDIVELAILWQRLQAAVDEADRVLGATAFSSIVREAQDYVTALLDPRGRNLVQCTFSIGSFIGTMPVTAAQMLDAIGVETIAPGDVLITNDPYIGTGHAYDITMLTPIFHRERLVGFAGNVAHMTDIGGLEMSGDGGSIFEEGICFPPIKLFERGREVPQVAAILGANVRVPDQVLGDLEAMIAANQALVRAVTELLDEHDLASLDAFAAESWRRSEEAMRAAISAVPNGSWTYTAEGDGFDETVRVVANLTIDDRGVHVDFEGTSPQSTRGINSPFNYTRAYSLYALKCVLGAAIPNNDGALRLFHVDAPVGSCLNPIRPAPTAVRGMTGQLAVNAIMGALAQVLPDRVIAQSGSCPSWMLSFNGRGADGRPFSNLSLLNGGLGARANADGYSALTFPVNCTSSPVELLEATTPIRVIRKELIPDSAGAGEHRGGLGQRIDFSATDAPVSVSLVADKIRTDPCGLAGGQPGRRGSARLDGEAVPAKSRFTLEPGATLSLELPGGGGYGPPERRAPERVAADVELGLISEERARLDYGTHAKGAS